MNGDNFFRLTHSVGHSNYFRWILNSVDRDIFRILCDTALTKFSNYYDEGFVVVNASINTIAYKAGLPYSTTKRSLNKLNSLGIALSFKYGANRNISYLIGFRTVDNERRYLLEHLINCYEESIINAVKTFFSRQKKSQRNSVPKLENEYLWCLKIDYRKLIMENISDPVDLKHARINDKGLYEALFNAKNEYQKSIVDDRINRILLNRSSSA